MATSITQTGANPIHQATLNAGEDQANDVIKVEQGQFGYDQTSVDKLVSNGAGFIHSVTFTRTQDTVAARTINIYDNTAASGTSILTQYIPANTALEWTGFTLMLDCAVTNGIYIDFSGAITGIKITISGRFT